MLEKIVICKDVVKQYAEDRGIENIKGCTWSNVYDDFIMWCENNNKAWDSISERAFKLNLSTIYGLKSKVIMKDGKSQRMILE